MFFVDNLVNFKRSTKKSKAKLISAFLGFEAGPN